MHIKPSVKMVLLLNNDFTYECLENFKHEIGFHMQLKSIFVGYIATIQRRGRACVCVCVSVFHFSGNELSYNGCIRRNMAAFIKMPHAIKSIHVLNEQTNNWRHTVLEHTFLRQTYHDVIMLPEAIAIMGMGDRERDEKRKTHTHFKIRC